jgi:hypothetical protein
MIGVHGQQSVQVGQSRARALLDALNGPWHGVALYTFAVIVVAHWMEHLLQAVQIFVLGWPRPTALGALGMIWPWLVSSEWMHYGYALVMLAGLIILLPGMVGLARTWWMVALVIQVWHHFEHLLLLGQAFTMQPLFGAAVPTSIAQLFFPRVELHLFYNVVVTVPMLIAMYFHRYPTRAEARQAACNCARLSPSLAAT